MKKPRFLLIIFILLLSTVGSLASDVGRVQLNHAQLMSGDTVITGPVANGFFMPLQDSAEAKHRFSGAISIPEHTMQTTPAEIMPHDIRGMKTQLFPGVTLKFVSHDNFLVPLERNIIEPPGSKSFWQIHVAPGRVWSEP